MTLLKVSERSREWAVEAAGQLDASGVSWFVGRSERREHDLEFQVFGRMVENGLQLFLGRGFNFFRLWSGLGLFLVEKYAFYE